MSKLDELLAELNEEIINYGAAPVTQREYDLLRSALRDLEADRNHWREARQNAIDAGETLKIKLNEALKDAGEVHRLLNLRCPGNNGCDGPVECQSYEAHEQGAPCPPGCCVMAEEKDVRSILDAMKEASRG